MAHSVSSGKSGPKQARVSILSQFLRERLTRPGQFALVGASATGIAVGFPDRMVGTLGFSLFMGMMIVATIAALFFRPRVTIKRTIAPRCMAGATVPMNIAVTNNSKRPALDIGAYEFRIPHPLRLIDDTKYVDVIEPGQSQTFEYNLYAPRRGHYLLGGATGLSMYPFGIMHAKRQSKDKQNFVVYPAFHPLRHIRIHSGRRYQPGGVAMVSHVGESMEFMGNREYRSGDRVRDLHPRSWARVGYPVVRQFEQEFLTRIAMLVDTYLPWNWNLHFRRKGRGFHNLMETKFVIGYDSDLLEANLSLSASVADCLAREDVLVDFFAAGPELYHFQTGRSLAHRDNMLDILACIERCEEDPLSVVAPKFSEQLRQTSTVIALLMHWSDERAAFFDQLRMQGMDVKLIILTEDRHQAEAAEAAGATHVTIDDVLEGVQEI